MVETRDAPGPKSAELNEPFSSPALFDDGYNRNTNRYLVVGERAELLNTRVDKAADTEKDKEKAAPTDPNKEIITTIMVKSKASNEEMDKTLAKLARREIKPLTDKEFDDKFGADPQAMERVLNFAAENGLSPVEVDMSSGRVLLKGKVKDFKQAFQVQMDDHMGPLGPVRERSGTISVPRAIANDVMGVFGLESKPLAHSNAKRLEENFGAFRPRISGGMLPRDAAKAYEFPTESQGKGQGVAIVQFGGGLDEKDNAAYYKENGLKLPDIQIVTINGAQMKLGEPADDEVALDSQVIGTVAPEAKQMIIFAPNSDQGFLDAITRATFTKPDETPNSAISISWGAPESIWTKQAIDNLNIAFKKAALKGISVFAATGDLGAKNGTDKFTADYPASDPYVVGTGGTELKLTPEGKIESEASWRDGGGGISERNPVPPYQREVRLPVNANNNDKIGKGVPDVAGNANPATGYRIRVRGSEVIMAGTSAVSPLYAALALRLNSTLGERVGFLNPFFYRQGSQIFRDMTTGDNGGYSAGPGWDAVTGWGVVNGQKMLDALKKELSK